MHLLEVPAVFAGLRFERDDRRGEQVIALAQRAVVIGAGIARREEDEPELGIDGRRLPDRCAAVLPELAVLRPGLVADLPGTRDRIERPGELAVLGVERLDAPADSEFGAREARDHEA